MRKYDFMHWITCAYAALSVAATVACFWDLKGWLVSAVTGLEFTSWYLSQGWRPWPPGFK